MVPVELVREVQVPPPSNLPKLLTPPRKVSMLPGKLQMPSRTLLTPTTTPLMPPWKRLTFPRALPTPP